MKEIINANRKNLSDIELSRLLTEHFQGGTLVEYVDGSIFEEEFGRAKVKNILVNGTQITIEPGEKIEGPCRGASLNYHDYNEIEEDIVEGVVYMSIPLMWCYAIAQPDTEIPKPA